MTGPATVVWPGFPRAPAPLAAIRRAQATGGARVVDDAGRPIAWGIGTLLREATRGLLQRALDVPLRLLAAATCGRRAPVVRTLAANGAPGPVVLVLPVLPDLSHTFLYREVAAILRQRPDWRLVVLAPNHAAPLHAEARELLDKATWLPRDGVLAHAARVLRWLLRRPARELFALYRCAGGGAGDLLGKHPLRDPRHPGNAFVLADLIAAWRPRHVHVYGSTWPANVALGAAHVLGVPLSISSYVDFEFPYAMKMLATKLVRARFFRVVTAFCRTRLQAMPGLPAVPDERVPVVHLGLDVANWQQRAAPSGAGVLVTAARFVPKKGLLAVPAALAALRAAGARCRWHLIGDGPELPALQREIATHGVQDLVELFGPRDSGFVRAQLLAADAAVLPCVLAPDGERDGIPIFLVEAMALGVPVVTTPVSGIPELVRDHDTGYFAAPDDSKSLAAVLARVLANRDAAQAVGDRGRAAVHATLDGDTKARELIAWIER